MLVALTTLRAAVVWFHAQAVNVTTVRAYARLSPLFAVLIVSLPVRCLLLSLTRTGHSCLFSSHYLPSKWPDGGSRSGKSQTDAAGARYTSSNEVQCSLLDQTAQPQKDDQPPNQQDEQVRPQPAHNGPLRKATQQVTFTEEDVDCVGRRLCANEQA